jgi:hypothetical protein
MKSHLCSLCGNRTTTQDRYQARPPHLGVNLIHYPDKISTPTAELSTVKMLLNSFISTPGACFTTFDLKDFYLDTPMVKKRIEMGNPQPANPIQTDNDCAACITNETVKQ